MVFQPCKTIARAVHDPGSGSLGSMPRYAGGAGSAGPLGMAWQDLVLRGGIWTFRSQGSATSVDCSNYRYLIQY